MKDTAQNMGLVSTANVIKQPKKVFDALFGGVT